MTDPTPINRVVMTQDLEVLSEALATAIQAQLDALASTSLTLRLPFGRKLDLPWALILQHLPLGSPQQLISEALASLLAADDDELAAALDLVGRRFGVWRGYFPPDALAAGDVAPALAGLGARKRLPPGDPT